MDNANTGKYIICATGDECADEAALYGDMERVYNFRAEAEYYAAVLQSEAVWGVDGNETATDVGITYYVDRL